MNLARRRHEQDKADELPSESLPPLRAKLKNKEWSPNNHSHNHDSNYDSHKRNDINNQNNNCGVHSITERFMYTYVSAHAQTDATNSSIIKR